MAGSNGSCRTSPHNLSRLITAIPVLLAARDGAPREIVLDHVSVIDMTGRAIQRDMAVLIRGDRIAAIERAAGFDVPGARVIDPTGKAAQRRSHGRVPRSRLNGRDARRQLQTPDPTTHTRVKPRGRPACLKAPVHADGKRALGPRKASPPCRSGSRRKEANRLIERVGHSAAESEDPAPEQPVMIDPVIVRDFPATRNVSLKGWIEDEPHPVVSVLEGLDELNPKARVDKITKGAVDARSIRTNVDNVLGNPVRDSRLEIEPRQDAVQEPAHCGAEEEYPHVATGGRLHL